MKLHIYMIIAANICMLLSGILGIGSFFVKWHEEDKEDALKAKADSSLLRDGIPAGRSSFPALRRFGERTSTVPQVFRRYDEQKDGMYLVRQWNPEARTWSEPKPPVFTSEDGIPFGGAK